MGPELTIDELAAEVGMTVRNIRAHQSRGLLPAPRLVGRTGYYGPWHVSRLHRIRQLQDEGLNLAAIARVVDDGRLTELATGSFADAAPERHEPGEVAARLGVALDDPAVARSIEMGLIAVEGDQIRVELPRLVDVAEQLAAMGVPLAAMLDVVEVVRGASAQMARSFMELADAHLVAKVVVGTGGDLEQLTGSVDRLHHQASAAIDVLFNQAMVAEIRTYLGATDDPSAAGEAGQAG